MRRFVKVVQKPRRQYVLPNMQETLCFYFIHLVHTIGKVFSLLFHPNRPENNFRISNDFTRILKAAALKYA